MTALSEQTYNLEQEVDDLKKQLQESEQREQAMGAEIRRLHESCRDYDRELIDTDHNSLLMRSKRSVEELLDIINKGIGIPAWANNRENRLRARMLLQDMNSELLF